MSEHEPEAPARILVVDDNQMSRKKLRRAVETLGHGVETAVDGASALEAIAADEYDLVLLDIVMPGLDGFDVLRRMGEDSTIRDLPVIVVSALDDDPQSVVEAIELGATDFLPKEFDRAILNARLGASLAAKRFRDSEREYFGRIEKLTAAAETVESGRVAPQALALDELAAYDDPIGRLAAVFRGMAKEIYEREVKLARTVQTLTGILMLLAFGLLWGLNPALSRLSSGLGSNPIGLALWVNGLSALACISVAAWRGKLRWLTRQEFFFLLGWAFLAGILQRLTMFTLAGHVEATLLSLIMTAQGFMAFVMAASLGLERASPKRMLGLTLGLVAITAVLWTRIDPGDATANLWLVGALFMPFLMALENIVLGDRRPEGTDIFLSVGAMFGLSLIFLLPLAWGMNDIMALPPLVSDQALVIGLLVGVAAGTNLLVLHIVATTGPVFASQAGYITTLCGIVWGIVLLGETMPLVAWAAFALVIAGMYLVGAKDSGKEIVLKRSFTGSEMRQPLEIERVSHVGDAGAPERG